MSDLNTFIIFPDDRHQNRKIKAITWLLTDAAKWFMSARKFKIVDPDLARKIEGKDFAGASIESLLCARYGKYMREELKRQKEAKEQKSNEDTTNGSGGLPNTTTEKEETETTDKEVDTEILFNSVAVVKQYVDENDIDVSVLLEAEKEGKKRKSLIKYLEQCQ